MAGINEEINELANELQIGTVSGNKYLIIGKNGEVKLNTSEVPDYQAGQICYDSTSLTVLADSGITGVRNNIGQELWYLVYNNSGAQIDNGKVCYASGVDVTNKVVTVGLADNSSASTSSQVLGLATHDIANGSLGLVTNCGIVRDFDTSSFSTGGLIYLGTSGNMTQTKPLYPATRIIMGSITESNATTGKIQVCIESLRRKSASRSYSFNASSSGTHYVAGFYDFATTDANLTQASTSITYGTSGQVRAAHVGIVPGGAGTVDTGQVGIRVTGTLDSETGTQTAAQTQVINDDITTLTLNEYEETAGKFSGQVTIELYVVSGSPTTYSLDFNYGFAKYEDKQNIDMTIIAFEAEWEGAGTDTGMDMALLHHKSTGWTYAATGFTPGNGDICRRSVDQATDGDVANGVEGAYKRVSLDTFVAGGTDEGYIVEVTTTSPNVLDNCNFHVVAESEELT
jgi:hypothetical protein